jgi:hypothetical protein
MRQPRGRYGSIRAVGRLGSTRRRPRGIPLHEAAATTETPREYPEGVLSNWQFDDTHWAGMVTTDADPFTPVSAIENSSIMMPNVYLDWMSELAIQNHLLSYCVAT